MRSINFTGTGSESGKRIVPLADLVRRELVLEQRDHTLARGVQRVVLLPASEVQHYPTMQSVSRDPVRDHLFRSWQGFAERSSHEL
jgi:hypothetical protein